jgi:hypothetical protein
MRFVFNPIFLSLLLIGCGGSSSSPSSTPTPSPTPAPTPTPELGVAVSVLANGVNLGTVNSCNQPQPESTGLKFDEVAVKANANVSHANIAGDGVLDMSGGVAAGDFDGDGWVDLYIVGGEVNGNELLRNKGDGSFEKVTNFAGVNALNKSSGPAFADINGDGLLDLFVGGVDHTAPALYINQGNETFIDVIDESGLLFTDNTFSATWADYDKDDDLDLMVTHWTNNKYASYSYLWQNNGDLTFSDATDKLNLPDQSVNFPTQIDRSFTPTFADINNDSWLDILFVVDNGATKVFINMQDGSFTNTTDESVITDNAGMGSAVGDYDNDGDLDWFVTSISYRDGVENFGSLTPGNRFYQNQGDGTFVDKTDETGTRHGFWGWAACFSDLNNDSNLDIFHVNGMLQNNDPTIDLMFENDPSRLFISNGDGTFTEQAVAAGIDDKGLGRGIVCFDYDRDGDQDLYVTNTNGQAKLFCNQGNGNHFINIQLIEITNNKQALGARIYVTTGETTQFRELRNGNNYVSQNPVEAHFGLGPFDEIDQVKIIWPDGKESLLLDVEANQFLKVTRAD